MPSDQQATLGHNSGALDLSLALDPDQLLADLRTDAAALIQRRDELMAAFDRFEAATAAGIRDAEMQAKAGDFVRQLSAHLTTVDARRTAVKAPVLAAQRAIDGYFKSALADPLDAAKKAVLAKVTAFLREQERIESERRRAEAERQRQEAARLAAEAEATGSAAMMDRALDAEERAAVAAATPAYVAPVRSDLGSVVSTRRGPWRMEVIDIAQVPIQYLIPNETVLLAVAKSSAAAIEAGTQPVPGVRFYRETLANIR